MNTEWNKQFWGGYGIAGSKGGTSNSTRYPQDDPEGIINQYDENGIKLTTGAISLTKIETLDLISEGKIQGLVSGEYKFLGNNGSIGYTGYIFYPYPTPSGAKVNWLRSIYWNNVPLIDSTNKYNFSNIDVSYTAGTPNGSLVGSQNNETTVSRPLGERLRGPRKDDFGVVYGSQDDYTKTYRIYNNNCLGIFLNVKFGQLYRRNVSIGENSEYGDVEITKVEYQIKYKPLYSNGINSDWNANVVKETVEGKISYGYIKSTRIDFTQDTSILSDKNFIGWEIQVKRITEDSQDTTISNQTSIDSLTEIYGSKFSYPNSALVRCNFNAEFFSQVPERAFHVDLLKVKIPSNYDPILHKYNGDWDGTFADDKQWSNNPAWCFYDLVTNRRYGLGKFFSEDTIDKWTLYKIGQYCDELVSDGFDGLEPRFTCNLYISSREEAIKVINDFASIFRGMIYYAGGSLRVAQDSFTSFEEVFIQFTEANVKDGDFNYTTAPRNTKNTVAIVRYNDKNNFYKPAIEYIENIEGIKKYGYRETEVAAYGCTSRGQAIRYGNWLLANEAETISFIASSEAALLQPGDIFKTYDSSRNFIRLGGRIKSYLDGNTGKYIELDSNIRDSIATGNLTGNIYSLTVTIPTYIYDPDSTTLTNSNQISGIRKPQIQKTYFTGINATGVTSGYSRIVLPQKLQLTGDFAKTANAVWTIDLYSGTNIYGSGEYWRTINVEENDLTSYKVFGIKYTPEKYNIIDNTLTLTAPTTNPQPPIDTTTPSCPKNLNITFGSVGNLQNIKGKFTLSWGADNLNNVDKFALFVTKDQEFTDESFRGTNPLLPIYVDVDDKENLGPYTYEYVVTDYGYYRFALFTYSSKLQISDPYSRGLSSCYIAGDISQTAPDSPFYPINIYGLTATDSGSGDNNTDTQDDPLDKTSNDTITSPSPYFNWSFNKNNVEDGKSTFFRITIREPSPTTKPSPVWYAEYTGLFPDATVEGSKLTFIFDINENINIIPPLNNYPRGPYRDYDLVVEAHDEFGNSSAGGNFGFQDSNDNLNKIIRTINISGLRDSTFTQGKGYDITRVTNQIITGCSWDTDTNKRNFKATPSIIYNNSLYQNIDISISGRSIYPDMKGCLLFYSSGGPLSTGIIYNGLVNKSLTQNNIHSGYTDIIPSFIPVDVNEWPLVFESEPILGSNLSSGWFNYFIYDSFDLAIKDRYEDWTTFLTGYLDYTRLPSNGGISGFRKPIAEEAAYSLAPNVLHPKSFLQFSDGTGNSYLVPAYDKASISNSGFSSAVDGLVTIRGINELRNNSYFYDRKLYFMPYTGNATGIGTARWYEFYSGVSNADNNDSYIKPNSISPINPGRYVKVL